MLTGCNRHTHVRRVYVVLAFVCWVWFSCLGQYSCSQQDMPKPTNACEHERPPIVVFFPTSRNRGKTKMTPPLNSLICRHCVVTAAPVAIHMRPFVAASLYRHPEPGHVSVPTAFASYISHHHYVYDCTVCVGDRMCSTSYGSLLRPASNQGGKTFPRSSVRVGRDFTAIVMLLHKPRRSLGTPSASPSPPS